MQKRRYPFIDSYTIHSEPVWKFDEGAIQALDVADPFRTLANGLCWFRELARRFLFQTIHDVELMLDREWLGREAIPSAGVINSQSVKAPHAKTWGYGAGKKVVGRKRHITVDTDGTC